VSPRIGRSVSLSACSLSILFLHLLVFVCLLIAAPGSAQQTPSNADPKTRTDVFLFVHPNSMAAAHIGLSYSKRIPHTQVESEIRRLAAVAGWKLDGKLSITDRTVRPDNPARFPPTTGAEFSVSDAPQFHDNAPVLAPYLQAFQAWDHLEILFVASDLVPYNGVANFRSPALDITLAKSAGIYDYLVTIREHSKALPPLISDSPSLSVDNGNKTVPAAPLAQNPLDSGQPAAQEASSLFWPSLFIIVGSLLTGGVALYLFAKRRQENLKPGRSR